MRRPRFLLRAAALTVLVAALAPGAASAGTPLVEASPVSLRFTSTELGHAEAQKLTLTNLTRHQLEVRFLPEPADAAFTHGHSSCPKFLPPHEPCSITVWFEPEHWGSTTGRLVYLVGHGASTAYQVHLSGEAHPPDEGARLHRR